MFHESAGGRAAAPGVEETGLDYSLGEEVAHALTHGFGAAFGLVGLMVMLGFSVLYGNGWDVACSAVYGATMVLCFGASTLYHGLPLPRFKPLLRQFDHASIFLLIAGTYTPFTLVTLRGPWGWTLFGIVWGLAVVGMVLELATRGRCQRLSLAMYLGLGWLVLVAVKPMLESIPAGGLFLLLGGGLCYSIGVIFYAWKRPAWHHEIWHLLVLAGAVLHFFAVLFYVIPLG